jgi:hypothetical protein
MHRGAWAAGQDDCHCEIGQALERKLGLVGPASRRRIIANPLSPTNGDERKIQTTMLAAVLPARAAECRQESTDYREIMFQSYRWRLVALLVILWCAGACSSNKTVKIDSSDAPSTPSIPANRAESAAVEATGLLLHEKAASEGYTLLAPNNTHQTYLMDADGRIVHTWNLNSRPALSTYLLGPTNYWNLNRSDQQHRARRAA